MAPKLDEEQEKLFVKISERFSKEIADAVAGYIGALRKNNINAIHGAQVISSQGVSFICSLVAPTAEASKRPAKLPDILDGVPQKEIKGKLQEFSDQWRDRFEKEVNGSRERIR